jgi:hypothetical protein
MPDYWQSEPDNYKRCLICSGTGKKTCGICGGRGGRYKTRYDYDYDGRSIARESWEQCGMCAGSGRSSCSRCGGVGSIRRLKPDEGRVKTDPPATPAASPKDLKIEFDERKGKVLDRMIDCRAWPSDIIWQLRDQLRAIEIESPWARSELLRLSRRIKETFGTSDHDARILTLKIDILEMIASSYSSRVAETWQSFHAQMPPVSPTKQSGVGSAQTEAKPKEHCTRCGRSNLQVHDGRDWCSWCNNWAAT